MAGEFSRELSVKVHAGQSRLTPKGPLRRVFIYPTAQSSSSSKRFVVNARCFSQALLPN